MEVDENRALGVELFSVSQHSIRGLAARRTADLAFPAQLRVRSLARPVRAPVSHHCPPDLPIPTSWREAMQPPFHGDSIRSPRGLAFFLLLQARIDLVNPRILAKAASVIPIRDSYEISRTEGISSMPIRLVLVDDHEIFRQSLCALLEKQDKFRVVGEATSGREALSIARKQLPDVVVMDIAMRDLNGIEGTRLIRAELPQVKILVLSSHADRRFVKEALDAGASGYVLKVNAYEDLRRALESVHCDRSPLAADVTAPIIEASYAYPGRVSTIEDRALSAREPEILQLVAEGLTSHQIGRRLFLATSTVETHRRNVVRKLGLHSVGCRKNKLGIPYRR